MSDIKDNLTKIHELIIAAKKQYGRENDAIELLAVSKTKPVAAIIDAFNAGQRAFAENHLQEALTKIAALKDYAITWHYIGKVQSNKTKAIASNFSWVHSVDRIKIAARLNAQRPNHLSPLNICIEVNVDNEANKSGILFDELTTFAKELLNYKNLKLRGLMCIPKAQDDFSAQCKSFHSCLEALNTLKKQGFDLDTLSMGMSNDFIAAIAEGSTIIRVGSAIFGARDYNA